MESSPNDRRALLAQALRAVEEMKAKLAAAESAALEPIAIIGAGCRFPGGASSLDEYWRLLDEGRDAVREIPPERWQGGVPPADAPWFAGLLNEPLDQFDPRFFHVSAREAGSLDPQQRLVLEAAWEALENAGQAPNRLAGTSTGVYLGITTHDYVDLIHDFGDGKPDVYTATGNAHNAAAGRLSYFLGLQGPSAAIDTACSSSLVAIHLACQSLRLRECTMALAGGVNALLTPEPFLCFAKWGMMAPDGRCKTFDARANGFVRSEGCGIVVLKRLSDALAGHDRILAVIRGSAVNQDGRSSGLTVPNGRAQEAVIRLALANAQAEPRDIDYVEAHGTGTALGDPIEAHALAEVFASGRPAGIPLRVGSVKTNLGHLESASGVAGLLKVVLSLQHDAVPKHLHFAGWNPDIDWKGMPVEIATAAQRWPRGSRKRVAGVSSFGFSGTNAHLIVEEAPAPKARSSGADRPVHVLALSAQSDAALGRLKERYAACVGAAEQEIGDICFTANTGRSHFERRAAFVAPTVEELKAQLADSRTAVLGKASPIVFLFTGQGAQYAGMGRDLYLTQPVFRAALEECDRLLRPLLEVPLLDVLYGERADWLAQTAYTQPALVALEYALAELWKSWGILPAAVLGHSVGEYAAACVAGLCSIEQALTLIADRARSMQQLPGDGAMAAVMAEEAVVREALRGYEQRVSIAAINAPGNIVISGERGAMEAIRENFTRDGVRVVSLAVSHAFHSPQMEPMAAGFAQRAARVGFGPGRVRVISSVTGEAVSGEQLREAEYWRRQVRETVQFRRGMEALSGHSVFVEIGPGSTLVGLGKQTLEGGERVWLPSTRQGQEWRQMLSSLAALYERGAEVDWAGFDRPYDRRRVALPTYPFERQRYWMEAAPAASAAPGRKSRGSGHPMLGERSEVAGSPAVSVWESEISLERLPYLADHCVQGSVIVPATAYIEMAMAACEPSVGEPVRLAELDFQRPLILTPGSAHAVQITLTGDADGTATVRLYSRPAGIEGAWTLLFTARRVPCEEWSTALERQRFAEVARTARPIDNRPFYEHFEAQGNQWGPAFRGVTTAWVGPNEAWARVTVPEPLRAETARYRAHPAVADACGHVLSAINAFGGEKSERSGALVGRGIDSVTSWGRLEGASLLCHARTRPGSEPNVLLGDVSVFDEEGNLVSEVRGAKLHYLDASSAEARPETWLYRLGWREITPGDGRADGHWIILADRGGVGQALAAEVRMAGGSCTMLASRGAEGFRDALAATRANSRATLVCLWGLDIAIGEDGSGIGTLQEIVQSEGVPGLLQTFAKTPVPGTRLWLVTRGAQYCEGAQQRVLFWQAAAWGLGRAFAAEHPDLWGGLVDLDPALGDVQNAAALGRLLAGCRGEDQVAVRGERILAARLERQAAHAAGPRFRDNAAYLITGGTGGLGLEVARWMVRSGARRLVLISRTPLPPRGSWRGLSVEDPRAGAVQAVVALEEQGAEIHLASVDVSDETAVNAFIQNWQEECRPPICGLVHAAGALEHCAMADLSGRVLESVIRPKLGAWYLHRALAHTPLDFFVMFSSASSVLSSARLGPYAAANALLDGLAAYCVLQGGPGLSINWGMWTEAGMAKRFAEAEVQALAEQGMGGMRTEEALECLAGLMGTSGETLVLPVDWAKWAERYPTYSASPLFSGLLDRERRQQEGTRDSSVRHRIHAAAPPDKKAVLLTYLTRSLEQVLGFEPGTIDPGAPLSQWGLDSLMGLEFKHRIDTDLGVSLAMVRLLEGLPLEAIADELVGLLPQEEDRGLAPPAEDPDELLLARIDDLSEAELDAALANLMHEGSGA